MKRHPLYLIYGLVVLALAASAEYPGWSLFPPRRLTGVPKSIRDNPGAYRSIYSGYSRYSGGK
jgi:hypothetical protein